jgi:hypothetical protein
LHNLDMNRVPRFSAWRAIFSRKTSISTVATGWWVSGHYTCLTARSAAYKSNPAGMHSTHLSLTCCPSACRTCLPVVLPAVVPPGYYLKTPGQAVPCPPGEWKAGITPEGNCTKCTPGMTTPAEASTAATACTSEYEAAKLH